MSIGAFGENFPYSNFHNMNMDWIVKIAKDFLDQYTSIQETISNGLESLDETISTGLEDLAEKETELENLLQAWYDTHSEDIADQLADALSDLNSWYNTHSAYLDQTLADNLASFNTQANAKALETIASIPADYTDLSNVTKSGVNGHQKGLMIAFGSNVNASIIEQGGFTPTGLNDEGSADRIRTSKHILVKEGSVIDCSATVTVKASISYYYDDGMSTARISYSDWLDFPITISEPDSNYIRIIIKKANDTNLTPAVINMFSVTDGYTTGGNSSFEKLNEVMKAVNGNTVPTLVQGGFDDKGQDLAGNDRVRTDEYIAVNNNTVITFTGTNVQCAVSFYTKKNGDRAKTTGWLTSPVSLAGYDYPFIRVLFKRTNSNTIRPSHITSLSISNALVLDKIETHNNLAIDSCFCKRDVTLNQIGTILGDQAFCIYDNKYYSVSDDKLYVQDSSFSQEGEYDIAIGHANNCQLSNSTVGHAYISGWDDQKVYEVDLPTHSIIHTYTLPTTGYTTVGVDDVNKIMYIFQRDSVPDTEDYYNFIVYDYVEDVVRYTRKTTQKLAYMQSIDFIDNKLFMVAGGWQDQSRNWFYIYDTELSVLGEYSLGDIELLEPEGVFVDRTTKDVYISVANWPTIGLYKIS